MSFKSLVCALLGSTLLLGCASAFSRITPGMTSFQVAEVMGNGPSRAQEFRDGSVAWFYGADQCVLIRNDVVVGKEVTEHQRGLSTPWVSLSQERPAQCAPAGERMDVTRTNVYTPIGVFTSEDGARKQGAVQQPADDAFVPEDPYAPEGYGAPEHDAPGEPYADEQEVPDASVWGAPGTVSEPPLP